MTLDFLQVHTLAHKFSLAALSPEEKTSTAIKCLELMEKYRGLHPCHDHMISHLSNLPEGQKFNGSWAKNVQASQPTPQLLEGEEVRVHTDKEAVFSEFLTLFWSLFVQCDFLMMNWYINKIGMTVQFSSHATDHGDFVKNRHFEYLFYQMVGLLYGLFWLAGNSVLEYSFGQPAPTNTRNLAQIEKRTDHYHTRSMYLLKSLQEKHPEIIDGVEREFTYYHMVKWLGTMVKFKENKFVEFVREFDLLHDHFCVVQELGMELEMLLMYAIGCIATKPFKSLAFTEKSTHFVDCQANCRLYEVLSELSNANFASAKRLLTSSELVQCLDAQIGYAVPKKNSGQFWKYLTGIIDQKAFLLVLSLTKRIGREKLIAKLGYVQLSQKETNDVSDRLILLVSVLNLGEANVGYDFAEDVFYRDAVDNEKKKFQLAEEIQEMDHLIRAEAAANIMRSMLVEKYFQKEE